MLTNTERQQIVEEVNAGTYGIDEALDDIAAAQKGEEVRKALYAEALVLNREGHAGSTDMIARQQIANLQNSISGQIGTLRTEVGEDIAGMQTALNGNLAAQDGKIAAQDATIANVVANYNLEYGSETLWETTGETGALAAGTTVTLSEDVSHFDYIDIYSFCGNSNVLDTVPVDADLQTGNGYALRWVNLSDPGSGAYEAYVRIVETKIHISGTTLTINHQVTYSNGASVSISGVKVTQDNKSTYMGEFGIMKIVGRKITANTEVTDIRTGADGTVYNSAGAAVRAQVQALDDAIPAVDDTLSVQGAAADAAAVGVAVASASRSGSGLTEDIKIALLDCFENVAWANSEGQSYRDMLYNALYPPKNLVGITATYTQSGTVYDTANLDSLKDNLTVIARFDDSTSRTITDYALSGTLTEGTSTITVAYGGKTTTFAVAVTHYQPLTVAITWSGSGVDNTASPVIDATEHDVYFTLPFVEGAAQISADATADTPGVRMKTMVYSDAECTQYVGAFFSDTQEIGESRSTMNCPWLEFDTETRVVPMGYYAIIHMLKSGSVFTSNAYARNYLNENGTEVVLK